MTIKALYPTVRPTLNLDFAKTKALDPRVTFTRASTGTFVGADGLIKTAASGAARFDHNPATGESLGLLVEEARTNVIRYSQSIGTSPWSVANITSTTTDAPDGSLTATTVTGTGTLSSGVSTTGTNTFSIYARSSVGAQFYFLYWSGSANTTSPIFTATSTWQRFSWTSPTSGSLDDLRIVKQDSSSLSLWGFQVELGAFPTSYIPTTSTTVTRAADVASMTGANFSSWYRQSEGTWLISFANDAAKQGSFRGVLCLGGNNTPRIQGDLIEGYGGSLSFTPTALTKAGLAYGSTEGRAVNGTVASGAGGTIDTETSVDIGTGASSAPSSYMLSTSISRLAYYPVRLPDAQLQALTAT